MNEKQYLHDLIASDRRNPDRQRLRAALRIARVQLRHDADPRSGEEHRRRRSRRRCAIRSMPLSLGPGHAAALDAAAAVALLGQRAHLGHARQQPQLDVRPDGRLWLAASVRGADNPAFCKAGSDHPSAKAFPMERAVRHLAVFDPKTKKYTFVDTCFSHAPPAVRLRRQRHAVDERRRPGGRLAEHEDVRRDRRRGEVAGLDGARARHQRQRQARRLRRAESAGRSGEGQAHRSPASTR